MGERQVADISMPGEDQGGQAPVGTVQAHGNSVMVSATHEEIAQQQTQQQGDGKPIDWKKRYEDTQRAYTKSQQELKAYQSGQKKPSPPSDGIQKIADQTAQEPQGIQKIVPDAPDPNIEPDTDVDSMLAKAKLTRKDVAAALDKSGSISDEHYKAIRKDNPWLSRKLANALVAAELKDDAITALKAKMSRDRFTQLVGGIEGEHAFYESARALPPEQQVQLDQLLQSGHLEAAISHFKVLTGQAGQSRPQAFISGKPGAPVGKGDITNLSEWKQTSQAAALGDKDAIARLGRVPNETIRKWSMA